MRCDSAVHYLPSGREGVKAARRPEVFRACAAYAAVLVVFVSGGLGNADSTNTA